MEALLSLLFLQDSSAKNFIKAQFLTKPRRPPDSTSLAEQVAIVTGSNGGLGLETCKLMLSHGLSGLVMGVRNVLRGEKAAASLRKRYPDAQIDVWEMDMLSYDSVQAFAKRCTGLSRLDMAILNAGTCEPAFELSEHGHELTFQVNYLSTALLAFLLLPTLKSSSEARSGGPGRLTLVSSNLALTAQFPERDNAPLIPSFDLRGPKWGILAACQRYMTTKTLVLMLVQKLAEQVPASSVIVNAVDPAQVAGTAIFHTFPLPVRVAHTVMKAFSARTLEQGAWTYLDAVVVKGKESHGQFVMNWEVCL